MAPEVGEVEQPQKIKQRSRVKRVDLVVFVG